MSEMKNCTICSKLEYKCHCGITEYRDANTTLKAEVERLFKENEEMADTIIDLGVESHKQEAQLTKAREGLVEIAETKIYVHTVYILKELIVRHIKIATAILKDIKGGSDEV